MSKPSMLNSVKWTTIGTIVNLLIKVGQLSLLARFLSKSDFGLVSISLLFISFTEIFVDLGFTAAVLHKQNIGKKEYSSLYWFNIIAGVICYGILFVITPLVSRYYNQPDLVVILRVLALNVIFSSISRLQRTFQQKNFKFKTISLIDITASIIMIVATIIFAFAGFGIYSLVLSSVLYQGVIAIIYLFIAIVVERNILFHFRFGEIIEYFKIGIYQVGSSVLNYLSSELDTIIISSTFSMEVLGCYTICKQLAVKVYGILNPIITKVLTPTLSCIQNNIQLLKEKYLNTLSYISFVDSFVYGLFIILSPIILMIMYGHEYMDNSLLFSLFCVNYIICSIGNPQGSLLIAVGKTNIAFYWNIFRIFTISLAMILGGFTRNIEMLVLFIIITNFISILPEIIYIYKPILQVSIKEYLKSFIVPFLVVICFFIIAIFTRFFPYWYLFVLSILFIVFYLIINIKFTPSIVNQLLQILSHNRFIHCNK